MEEWKEYKVGDIFNIQNGYAFKSGEFVDYSEDTYEVLKIGHIEVGGGLRSDPKRTFVKRESKYLKWVLEKNDIVMGMTDMKSNVVILGIPALIDKSDKYVLNQRVARLSLKDSQSFDIYFCYYQMQWKEYISELRKTANSGVQVNLTTSGISNSLLFVPDFEIQKKIGGILRTLDDKIKNNRRVNDNLEQQAQALFKSWFVDFEPFKNGEFVESELGMIPKGWRVGSIYDYIDVVYGAPYKSSLFNDKKEGLPLIRIRDLKTNAPQFYTPEILPNTEFVKAGDIVAGMDAEFIPYVWLGEKGVLNQRCCKFRGKNEAISNYYILFLIKPELEYVQSYKTGTTVSHLGKSDIDRFRFVTPPLDVVKSFSDLVDGMLKELVNRANESRRLAELRDTLLPKLMSGELKVNEVEECI